MVFDHAVSIRARRACSARTASSARSDVRCEPLEERRLFAIVGSGAVFWGEISEENGVSVTLSENWFASDWNTTRTVTVAGLPDHTKVSASFSVDAEAYNNYSGDQDQLSVSIGGGGQTFNYDVLTWPYPVGSDSFSHTGSTVTISFTGSGFEPGDTWYAHGGANAHFAVVAVGGGGATSENGSPVVLAVARDNDPILIVDELVVGIDTSGDATRGQDYQIPDTVTIPAGQTAENFDLTPLDDDETEAEKGNSADVETVLIGPEGSDKYQPVGQPSTVTIADDATWWYSAWEPLGRPIGYTGEPVGSPIEQDMGNVGDKLVTTFYKRYEWRYLGVMDVSDDWGEPADITGQGIAFSQEQTVGAGGQIDVDLGALGLPVSVGGTYYREGTSGTSTTHTFTNGLTPSSPDALYQVAGYGLYAYIEKRQHVLSNGQVIDLGVAGRVDLGFTGELSAAYRNRLERFWLDEEDDAPVAVVRTGPAAPPTPPSVI